MQHPQKRKIPKSRGRWIWVSEVGALALAVALLVLLPVIQQRFPARKQTIPVSEQPVKTLALRESGQVESITVSPMDGESYTLVMQEGTLYAQSEGGLLELDADKADELLKAVTEITVQGVVTEDVSEVEEHLGEMGLEPPLSQAVVRYADGSEETIQLGGTVPGTSYSYYRWSGGSGVYMGDEGIRDALGLSLSRLLPFSQVQIAGELVEEIRLDEMIIRFHTAETGQTTASLTEPYVYPISSETCQSLQDTLSSFRLGAREPAITNDNRGDYGFDDPLCTITVRTGEGYVSAVDAEGQLTVYQVSAQEYHIVIGQTEGDYFYTCQYGDGYYLISRFLVEYLVQATPRNLATRNPADMGDAFITRTVINANGATLEMTASRTEQTDENGAVTYAVQVAVNGVSAPQERLDSLTDGLRQLTANGEAPANWIAPAQESPRWELVLETENGQKRLIQAYRLDAFTDVLCVDGVSLHTVDDEAIDRLLGSAEGEEEAEIPSQYYVCEMQDDQASLSLLPQSGRFSFSASMLSSYLGVGSYEEKEDMLLLYTDDGQYHYAFRRVGASLVFVAEQSSDPGVSCLTDGAIFRQQN